MSTTTKIDTSRDLLGQLDVDTPTEGPGYNPEEDVFWKSLGGKYASRWGGIGNPRWECWTFAIKLPRDVVSAYRLMRACARALPAITGYPRLFQPMLTLLGKIQKALGWPNMPVTEEPVEAGFRESIREDPGDLANWSAYSDWLQEHGQEEAGLVIARWLAPEVWSQKKAKEERDRKRWEEIRRENKS